MKKYFSCVGESESRAHFLLHFSDASFMITYYEQYPTKELKGTLRAFSSMANWTHIKDSLNCIFLSPTIIPFIDVWQ